VQQRTHKKATPKLRAERTKQNTIKANSEKSDTQNNQVSFMYFIRSFIQLMIVDQFGSVFDVFVASLKNRKDLNYLFFGVLSARGMQAVNK
jgi:hypothetical protein